MRVILNSVKAEVRLVFNNICVPGTACHGLSAQGKRATFRRLTPHSKPVVFQFDSEQLPPLSTWLAASREWNAEGKAPVDRDALHSCAPGEAPQDDIASPAASAPEHRYAKKACPPSDATSFRLNHRELFNATLHISLTTIESLLLNQLVLSRRRVCSKKELILAINRDPSKYTGLEMCLSRLQDKFQNAYGERLFRSVRNQGYCLVQDVKTSPSLSNCKK